MHGFLLLLFFALSLSLSLSLPPSLSVQLHCSVLTAKSAESAKALGSLARRALRALQLNSNLIAWSWVQEAISCQTQCRDFTMLTAKSDYTDTPMLSLLWGSAGVGSDLTICKCILSSLWGAGRVMASQGWQFNLVQRKVHPSTYFQAQQEHFVQVMA